MKRQKFVTVGRSRYISLTSSLILHVSWLVCKLAWYEAALGNCSGKAHKTQTCKISLEWTPLHKERNSPGTLAWSLPFESRHHPESSAQKLSLSEAENMWLKAAPLIGYRYRCQNPLLIAIWLHCTILSITWIIGTPDLKVIQSGLKVLKPYISMFKFQRNHPQEFDLCTVNGLAWPFTKTPAKISPKNGREEIRPLILKRNGASLRRFVRLQCETWDERLPFLCLKSIWEEHRAQATHVYWCIYWCIISVILYIYIYMY